MTHLIYWFTFQRPSTAREEKGQAEARSPELDPGFPPGYRVLSVNCLPGSWNGELSWDSPPGALIWKVGNPSGSITTTPSVHLSEE